jgi:hypothetical protein
VNQSPTNAVKSKRKGELKQIVRGIFALPKRHDLVGIVQKCRFRYCKLLRIQYDSHRPGRRAESSEKTEKTP